MRNLNDLLVGYNLSLDRIFKIAQLLQIDAELDVILVECDSIYEFNRLTGKPYHVGAMYIGGVIISQPFHILKEKGVFKGTIEHELLHHLIQKNFSMPKWLEEGLILYLTGAKIEELKGDHKDALRRFIQEVSYENIPSYVARYRNDNRLNHNPGLQFSSSTAGEP